jgi:PAS domain S-box-containing protein
VRLSRDESVQGSIEGSYTEEKARLRAIFASSPDAITVSDLNGNVIDCNQATLDMGGFSSKEEVIGKNCFEFVAKKDQQRAMIALEKILGQGSVKNAEYTFSTKDGCKYTAELFASAIKDSSGKPTGFVTITKTTTESKQREAAARKSEIPYWALIENSSDIIQVVDSKGVIRYVSPSVQRILGYKPEELIGRLSVDVVHPEDLPKVAKGFEEAIQKPGVPVVTACRCKHKDGTLRVIEGTGINYLNRPTVNGFISSMHDITERKKMEEALRESEEKYRKQFEEALDAIFVADAETGIIVDCNRAASELVGREKSELIGKHQRILHPPQQIDGEFSKTFKQHLKEKEGQVLETQVIDKKGEIKDVAVKANVFELRGEKMLQGIFRDITENKQAEGAVRESQQKFERLFMNNPEAADYLDLDFHILNVNPRFEELFGYSLDEVKGKHINDVVVPKDKIEEAEDLDRKARKGYAYHDTVRKRKDGSLVPVSISAAPIIVEDELVGTVGLYKDITERRQMEKKLEEYSEHLEELVEKRTEELTEAQERLIKSERLAAVGELATMVGHDLRNPLQSINNATYYVSNELLRLPVSQKAIEMLQVINDSVDYADKIIRDLQDFSSTKKSIVKKTNINTIVKETLSQVETPRNIELITELGHFPRIEADKNQIKRTFLNLAVNGIQAMENGGRLKVSTKKTKDFIEVSFEDTGIGLPKEKMKKLFTPFFTTKAKGLGMGLAICKKFVESHGGSIEVESEEGKGSTFTVKLPIQQENGSENQ